MAVKTFYIKKNDELPVLEVRVKVDGVAYDLSAASAKTFTMMASDGTVKVNAQAAAWETDGSDGIVTYAWSSGDTDTVGTYDGEFKFTIGGNTLTVPNREHLTIQVVEELV